MPKARKTVVRAAHRPLKPIDWDHAASMMIKGASGVQIAAVFDMHPQTLYDRCDQELGMGFTEFSYKNRSKGDYLLHKTQFEVAVNNKDRSLLIWLGKNRLGQKDNPDAPIVSNEILSQFSAFMETLQRAQDEKKALDAKKAQEARIIDDNNQSSD